MMAPKPIKSRFFLPGKNSHLGIFSSGFFFSAHSLTKMKKVGLAHYSKKIFFFLWCYNSSSIRELANHDEYAKRFHFLGEIQRGK